jgi:alkanesulfonate monooxygenase SsuD/methylene tetrahydromethanopterin reductase-like flavin-dependent oxidoreductase (luciferase family)
MDEAHDLIVQAWTRPGPFAFEGEHYNYRYVNIWPRPIQQPHPPIWLPGVASTETIDFAARHRYPYMTAYMPTEQRKKVYDTYRRLAEDKYGYEAKPEQLAFCIPCVVAETDDMAMEEGAKYVPWLFDKGFKVRPEFFVPPGYMSPAGLKAALSRGTMGLPKGNFKELVDSGIVIAGSPATIIEKLSYHTDVLHAGMVVTGSHVGDMPEELVWKHQEIMAKEVMPYFRDKATPTAETTEVATT